MARISNNQVKLSFLDLLFSHHPVDQLNRCYRVNFGTRSLFVCARCLGLYPVLASVLVVSLCAGPGWTVSPWVMALFCVPALTDWGVARLGLAEGVNTVRTVTGAFAGVGLGLALTGSFRNPADPNFWYSLGSLAVAALLTEGVARFAKMQD
jgi:uncharacterized membrane protein